MLRSQENVFQAENVLPLTLSFSSSAPLLPRAAAGFVFVRSGLGPLVRGELCGEVVHGLLEPVHEGLLLTRPMMGCADEDITEEGDEDGFVAWERFAEAVHEDGNDWDIGFSFGDVCDAVVHGRGFFGFASCAFGEDEDDLVLVEGIGDWFEVVGVF